MYVYVIVEKYKFVRIGDAQGQNRARLGPNRGGVAPRRPERRRAIASSVSSPVRLPSLRSLILRGGPFHPFPRLESPRRGQKKEKSQRYVRACARWSLRHEALMEYEVWRPPFHLFPRLESPWRGQKRENPKDTCARAPGGLFVTKLWGPPFHLLLV
jgi:hypothetical protein